MSFSADANGLGKKAQVTVPAAKQLTPLVVIEYGGDKNDSVVGS
jgi:hypothetical protein